MKHRVLFDLECTCWDDEGLQFRSEVIEIGAIKFHPKTFREIDSFQVFVKPQLHPKLSHFCIALTGITQKEVDSGVQFSQAYKDFMDWSENSPLFLAWGAFDHTQLASDCELHGLQCFPPRKYMNAKTLYTYFTGVRGAGLGKRLNVHGLEFEGEKHRGLDDSRNTLRLLRQVWEDF